MTKNDKIRNEQTSEDVASKAARLLADKNSSDDVKSVAGSALTQAPDDRGDEGDKQGD
ncbi:MAG: hypothetical protein KAI24_24000 [Planctomycetes bacterium]|nr:hypothetical protein [Planctomycetota bacterium]